MTATVQTVAVIFFCDNLMKKFVKYLIVIKTYDIIIPKRIKVVVGYVKDQQRKKAQMVV